MNQAKLGIVVLCVTVLAAFLGGLYAYLSTQGWFEPWRPLDKPPVKAVKISAHKEELPFIETSDGEIYLCSYSLTRYDDEKNCWVKKDRSQFQIIDSHPCWPIERFDIPKPPGKVVDMVEFESCEMGLAVISATTTQHDFALLEDGSVWSWKYSHNSLALIGIFLYTVAGFLGGLIISLGIAVIATIVDVYRNKRKTEAT